MKTPSRLLSVYNTVMAQWSAKDVLAYANGKCNGKRKRSVWNRMYP